MDLDLNHLSKDSVAKLLDVSVKSVDLYTKQKEDPLVNHPDPGHYRFYVWTEVMAWRLRREIRRAPVQKFEEKKNLTEAKLAGQNLLNEKLKRENDVRAGQLLEIEDVRLTWSDALVDIKQAMRNVGHTAATEIQDGMTYGQKKRLIDGLVFTNLNETIARTQAAAKPDGSHEG